jgi:hypothetical protein
MSSAKYRITSPTLALFPEDSRQVAHTIPEGTIVRVDNKTFDGNKLVNVTWQGKQIMMFAQDLRSRAMALKINNSLEFDGDHV